MKQVKLHWHDISNENEWIDYDELEEKVKEYKKEKYHSFGYVIYEDEDVVVLAFDTCFNHDGKLDLVSYSIFPKKVISKVEEL